MVYLFTFKEKGREGEREGEQHQFGRDTLTGCLSHALMWDLARNPGTCPDWESNWRPFCSQAAAQPTEPHQPGLYYLLFYFKTEKCLSAELHA